MYITNYSAPLGELQFSLLLHFNSGREPLEGSRNPHSAAWGKQSRAQPNFRLLLFPKKEKDFSAMCLPVMIRYYCPTR